MKNKKKNNNKMFKAYDLRNGSVIVPSNTNVLSKTIGSKPNYAYLLVDRNGEMKPILVRTENTVEEDKGLWRKAFTLCYKEFPQIINVYLQHVEPLIDRNGLCVNRKEAECSNDVLLVRIPEVGVMEDFVGVIRAWED